MTGNVNLKRAACVSLLALVAAACAAKGEPAGAPVLTPMSDPDVQSAVRHIPAGSTPMKKIVDVRPRPPARRAGRATLDVVLDSVVTASGEVKVVSIVRTNDAGFARECIRAVQQWRFEPARTSDGKPIATWMTTSCTLKSR